MGVAALWFFEGLRLLLRLLVLVLSAHFLRAAFTGISKREPAAPPVPDQWPCVTVQLPMRNEFYVVERAISAACELDYPIELLEVQVLDDSEDATRGRAAEVVERFARRGIDVKLLHRAVPTGYKAGALNAGLASARGELIAIFDADCVPPRDFLRRMVPWFSERDLGCVQARWSFLNRNRSVLTRVQALVLDGLFAVDQFSRTGSRLPLQFNGTNGVWRRAAIDESGGWDASTLAEDAELSFRAQLIGWRVQIVRSYAVPTEIPVDMPAFRAQQRRWAMGSAQILRSLGMRILRAPVPWRAKLLMFMHLGRHSIDPLILFACVTAPLTNLYGMRYLVDYGVRVNVALVVLVNVACLLFYGVAVRQVGESGLSILFVPLVVPLAMGMSLLYTVAFAQGLFQRGGRFVRTPKVGDRGEPDGPTYASPVDPLAFVELGFAAAHAYFTYRVLARGDWPYAAFFLAVTGSFAWVGLGSLLGSRRRPSRGGRLDSGADAMR